MSETWVVNASPVITLAKIGQLDLLERLAGQLLLPDSVISEILAGPPSDPSRQAIERGWGISMKPSQIPSDILEWSLGQGESAVLALAREKSPCTAVLDDAVARACAKTLGIPTIGTLGVIVRAKKRKLIPSATAMEQREAQRAQVPVKKRKLIPSATAILQAIRSAGLYLDDDVIRVALESVGETWDSHSS